VKIRTALVSQYPYREDMFRLAEDAGPSIASIRFSEKAISSWRNILARYEAGSLHCFECVEPSGEPG
jgi:hypothetical protein